MLSVPVQKDIGEYKPKVFKGLTLRTLVCTVGGVGSAFIIGVYMGLVLGLDIFSYFWLIWAAALPFWAAGIVRPRGMVLEAYILLWARHNLTRNRLVYSAAAKTRRLAKPKASRSWAKAVRRYRRKGLEGLDVEGFGKS